MLLLMGSSPPTAKTCLGGGGEEWPEKVEKRFTLVHSSFLRNFHQVTGNVGLYGKVFSAFVKTEEKQKQRKRRKNYL
jgi:hypothetical protein